MSAKRVALIVAKDFAEPDTIRDVVRSAPEGTTFAIRSREATRDPDAPPPPPGKQHKTIPLTTLLADLGVEPEIEDLDPEHKGEWGDHRAAVRDEKIKRECDRVIVFLTPQTKTLDAYRQKDWIDAVLWPNVRIIERGKAAAKRYKKGRKID